MKAVILLSCVSAVLWSCCAALAAQSPPVRHPNLFLNPDEIQEARAKIQREPWAARLLEDLKEVSTDRQATHMEGGLKSAILYVLTGDPKYAEAARGELMAVVNSERTKFEKADLRVSPVYGEFAPISKWAWSYDLIHETLSDPDRQAVESLLRTAARTVIESLRFHSTTPNLVFMKHWQVAVVGYTLGDREFIEWGLNDPGVHGPQLGGFYPVMDSIICDGYFWGEAPIYALHNSLHGMLAMAEAARHYDGTDLYRYVSKKSGGSIKGIIDGYIRLAYPLEATGIEGGSLRLATFGDNGLCVTPLGELVDTFLVNPVAGGRKRPGTMNGALELAYARYGESGYAWLLGLNRTRDASLFWGPVALTHGRPLPGKPEPPPAPSGVYPGQGLAVLRADETPRYWTSSAMAAVMRLSAAIGHGHKDYFELMLHGRGRLLYPDLQLIGYEPTYQHWTNEGIAHNTLLVDCQSPRPGPCTTRQDFAPEAKFFAVTASAFENVNQTRALVMTPDYLADVFRAADTQGQSRTFDWVLHGVGRLYPGNPAAYRPTHALLPYYWWAENERGRATDAAWQADWVQHSAGVIPGIQAFGKEWFERTVGVRMAMLGAAGTEVYFGDGPMTDSPPYSQIEGNPEGTLPMLVARRTGAAATFAAVHEPYDTHPAIRAIRRIQETGEAVGIAVESDAFSDRVLVAFQPDKPLVLRSADGEAFDFQDHGYLRAAGGQVTVRGPVKAFRIRAAGTGDASATIDGKAVRLHRDGEWLTFGDLPAAPKESPAAAPPAQDLNERQANVHYFFLPEEAHLKAGGEREVAMHLRCVGQGKAQGRLRLSAPQGISVQPEFVDLAGIGPDEERTMSVRIKAAADAANALHAVRIGPQDGASAAADALLVSVGVVITDDARIPLAAQSVIRAPGYTMRIDHHSGVGYGLLDGDGHRRHGHVRSGNSCYGMPGVEQEGRWALDFSQPCRFVWPGANSVIVVSGSGIEQVRLRYTFQEDRIVLALVAPTNPTREHTMWLGEFDALGEPLHNGGASKAAGKPTDKKTAGAITADWFFFPHPVHRQGLLIVPPPQTALWAGGTAVHFPLRPGQEVSLQFATEDEAKAAVKPAQNR